MRATLFMACPTASSRSRSTCSNTSNQHFTIFEFERLLEPSSRLSFLTSASYSLCSDDARAFSSA